MLCTNCTGCTTLRGGVYNFTTGCLICCKLMLFWLKFCGGEILNCCCIGAVLNCWILGWLTIFWFGENPWIKTGWFVITGLCKPSLTINAGEAFWTLVGEIITW